ncbi:MAG: Gfo/Idh/MocA family protein [Limisphaerales bacterium]
MAARSRDKSSSGSIRYAVVGLGHIAQVAILPGFKNARKSELTGLVSSSPQKLQKLAKRYGVENTWSYDEYEECLHSGKVDAVFIALPNDMHREFTVRAARAGVHVLCEKPLAVTARDCQVMIDAAKKNRVKLMTAYRLHMEETNLRANEIAASGKIGELKYFNSCFSFQVTDPDNIRLKEKRGGGTLYDIGVYCLNAARHIFQAEPTEVFAYSTRSGGKIFREIDESTSVVMRFPNERLATFTTSFGAADAGYYEVTGTKGSLRVEPAFEYVGELGFKLKVGEKEEGKTFAARDQFGAEISYFSDCILKGKEPEPSGVEGLIDVQIVQAMYQSAKSGRPVKLPKFPKKPRPSMKQAIKLPPVKKPEVIAADSPHD